MVVKSDKLNDIMAILGKTGTLAILNTLSEGAKRYNELRGTVASDRTLSQRIKELEECALIETVSMKIDNRFFVHYKLSTKGEEIIKKIKEIK